MSLAMLNLLAPALWETIYMVFVSGIIAMIGGIPLGMLLFSTRTGNILENKSINFTIGGIANIVRSIPFIILIVALIPVTTLIIGTSIGTTATIVPLSIGAIPFVARIVENALLEVPKSLIEAGLAMGATAGQVLRKVLLPEALPAIINGMTVIFITLVGYSAMAGTLGGGGLGDVAIRYGYQRFDTGVMIATIVILVILVQLMQMLGDRLANYFSHS